ncbi:MAG TPA: beta-ketoacyl-[acyl-carrier-protein] synthase family protein [Phycisphaerae bacterium]|nr:beta-ketoacyl-[acyl-carrier-protein] synthase family protein [Phycisphaerae bacterium]
MRKRVVVTGIGWVTPLGHDIESVWTRLVNGDSGIAPTTLFDARTFPTTFSAEVKGYDFEKVMGNSYEKHREVGRNTKFSLGACLEAWRMSGLNSASLDPYAVGTYLGAGEGGLDFDRFAKAALAGRPVGSPRLDTKVWGELAKQTFHTMHEIEQEPSMSISHLAHEFNARGPSLNCLTACAASTQAIGEAAEIIRHGDADVMISGGSHSMIHPFGVTGFNRLTALSTFNTNPRQACRPFDATRGGFVLGEGAGIVILESLEHAQKRGAKVLAEIAGFGSSCDAYAVTDQHPDGRGAMVAIQAALKDAGMTPRDIQYINAHGTGTKVNDSTETMAIKGVFGEHSKHVPISSIKSMMGHLIAAAGAVELITCILTIRDGVIPPTANYATPDPECDLDYVPNTARKARVDAALSNSFGFGGQNDTLIVKRFVA